MKSSNDFSTGSIPANILKMALPMTFAQLINVLYNLIDRMYISRIENIGDAAFTGVGITFPIMTLIIGFANLFGMGGAPLCSIARGQGDNDRAEKIMGNATFLLIIAGIIIPIVGLLVKEPLLYMLGASSNTYTYADNYITIYLIGTIFVMMSLGLNGFINSQGFGTTGMMTVLLGAVINIILDPIFIFIFDMGVRGAALATVISQAASTIWVIHFLTGDRAILRLSLTKMRLSMNIVKDIVLMGTSGFVMALTNSAVQIVCNSTLYAYGGDLYVNIMTVINSLREVVMMPVNGVINGGQPVVGYNYGAEKYDRVKSGIKFVTVTCIIYTTLIWVFIMALPEVFLRIFNGSGDVITYGVRALKIYFFGFFMMALQFSGQSSFLALGKSKHAIFFSLLRKAVIVVPLTLVLPRMGFGTDGVFLAEPISNFIGGLACFATFMITIWPKLKNN